LQFFRSFSPAIFAPIVALWPSITRPRLATASRGSFPKGYNPNANPSLALLAEPKELHLLPDSWTLKPEFFGDGGKNIAVVKVPSDSSVYGTGEVTGRLLRNGRSIGLWNQLLYSELPRRHRRELGMRMRQ
jgi:hypothetical protein